MSADSGDREGLLVRLRRAELLRTEPREALQGRCIRQCVALQGFEHVGTRGVHGAPLGATHMPRLAASRVRADAPRRSARDFLPRAGRNTTPSTDDDAPRAARGLARLLQRALVTMNRVHQALSADVEWISVSVGRRCPVCGGSTGCKTYAEGPFAACGQEPSDWPMTSGAWLHRVRAPHTGKTPHAAVVPHTTVAARARVDAPSPATPTAGSAS